MKHNREQTITLEFQIRTGHGRGGGGMGHDLFEHCLISAIKYSCTIYKYINIIQEYQRNKNIHNT